MPAQQGLGRDDEAGPTPPRQQPRGRGEKDPIGVGELGPGHLPTQDRQLMAQHDDLEVLRALRSEPPRHQVEDASGQDVQERSEHAGKPPSELIGSTEAPTSLPLRRPAAPLVFLPIVANPFVTSLTTG